MSISATLKNEIIAIAGGDGFWKSSSEDTFLEAGELLISKGFSEDEVVELLSELYYATAACYGD
jgi:uncharacterized protein with PhoU and TrkA domain